MKYLILLLLSFTAIAETVDPVIADASVVLTTPTQREDNTALGVSEIQGFNLYCGSISGDYQSQSNHPGATLPETIIAFSLQGDGDYYCAVTTVDIDGRESLYSNEIALTVKTVGNPKAPIIKWRVIKK
ncbi:hypothetical protein KAU11_10120 [Candidatus Babeliales bacterium]|nr:hypothetical protein [Candidatus Babeliales bacterium]